MAYVGTPIDTTNQFQSLQGKRFSGDGSETEFTLDIAPSSVLDIEVFVENVRQDPNSAYTLNGTTLTFTGAPPSGTNNIYVVHQAKAVGTIDVPATYKSEAQTISGARTHTGVVGIGAANSTSVPLRIFDTGSNTATTELLRLETGSSTDDSGIKLDFRTAHTNGIIEFLDGSGSFDGNFVFKTGTGSALATPAERLRITPNGLAIGGTGTANTLDDYEEGTFTATLRGATEPGTKVTSTALYTKVGRQVTFAIDFNSVNTTGYGGAIDVYGLPFASNANVRTMCTLGSYSLVTFDSANYVVGEIGTNNTVITPQQIRSANSWASATHSAGSDRYIWIAGTYQTP